MRAADHIYLWRLLANSPNRTLDRLIGLVPELARIEPVLPAVPSDIALVSITTPHSVVWQLLDRPMTPYEVLATAQQTGATPREVALRATALHIECPEITRFSDSRVPDPVDLTLVKNRTGSLFDFPEHSDRASAGQVLYGHFQLGLEIPEVLRRLVRYGFDVGPADHFPEQVEELDVALLSTTPTEIDQEWLSVDFPVPPAQVVLAAQALGIPADVVRKRLERYGFVVQDGPIPRDDIDLLLLSHYLDADPPWLDPDVPVSPGHLVFAANQLDVPLSEVVERLTSQGFDCPAPPVEHPVNDDQVLLSRGLDRRQTWLAADQPVPWRHVQLFCRLSGASPWDTERRLRAYGLDVSPVDRTADLDAEALRLLSINFDGGHPWLDSDDHVSLARLVETGERFSMTVTEVADHLRRLGLDVPDPADMIRAAIPKIPLAG
jgi:hypothetical protein